MLRTSIMVRISVLYAELHRIKKYKERKIDMRTGDKLIVFMAGVIFLIVGIVLINKSNGWKEKEKDFNKNAKEVYGNFFTSFAFFYIAIIFKR